MTIGTIVTHYEIVAKLGEGGMGVVYKARDLSLHRFVALKFLPPEIVASPDKILRFEAEARAISALNHPNIATIHAMDEDHGRRFLVLEFLEGGTLRERIRKYRDCDRPFPLSEALKVGVQLAEGLGHAHRKRIVHRDIKPENVMFTIEGTLRITDFGLAKSSHASEITRDGTTVGTAAYMAPEQALRNETSPRSDLFAVGIVMYELVAGRRPFTGGNEFVTLQAMLNEEPPALRTLRPETPPDLDRIVFKLLAKDPGQRYQNGDELARDLRALDLNCDPTVELNYSGVTQSLTRLMPVTQLPARRKIPLVAICIAGALVVSGAAWWRIERNHPGTALPMETQLAVLPFSAPSGNAEDAAFGNGLAGIVAGRLASLGANVVPENDLERNRIATPADARRIFGIPIVLAGKIGREPSGASRVVLDVIDTASDRPVRSATVTADTSTEPLQDKVLTQAVALLHISPDPNAMSKARAENTHTASAYDYYVLGNGYLQRWDQAGNLGFALASFQKAINVDPSYAMAYAGLAAAYWQQYVAAHDQQDLDRARDAAIQALSRNENLDSPHITLGAIAVHLGQVDEGIRQLRMALDRDPVNAEACRELANAYVAAGKPDEAEATYRRAIQYRANFWLGYNDLAVFFNDRGRYGEAEQTLHKAATLTPDNEVVFRNLGGVQMARGEWTEAESSFRRAIELRPRGSVYSNLGTLYIYTGRYADAVPVLEKAVALSGSERYADLVWGNLGDAYRWTKGREKDAPAAYAKAIELSTAQLAVTPNDATLLSQIAVYHAKAGQFAEARRFIDSALAAAPHDPAVLYRSALVLEIAGHRKQSLAALRAAIGSGYAISVVEKDPELASLRADPAYRALTAPSREIK
jgi:tetratricopeptide (TPR) repeat protein